MSRIQSLHHRRQASDYRTPCAATSHDAADDGGSSDVTAVRSAGMMPMAQTKLSRREKLIWLAVCIHGVIFIHLRLCSKNCPLSRSNSQNIDIPSKFHGGNPLDDVYGSCFQGADKYAMCNPYLSVKLIIVDDQQDSSEHAWLYRYRKREDDNAADAKQIGLLQDYVSAGESAEAAVRRLVLQSIDIDINALPEGRGPLLLGVYSKPPDLISRSTREGVQQQRHIASAVYILRIPKASIQSKTGKFVKSSLTRDIAQKLFEEDLIALSDYREASLRVRYSWGDSTSARRSLNKDEIGPDIARSLC